jgi:hypothetical protein
MNGLFHYVMTPGILLYTLKIGSSIPSIVVLKDFVASKLIGRLNELDMFDTTSSITCFSYLFESFDVIIKILISKLIKHLNILIILIDI